MLDSIKNRTDLDNELIENFFNIWILKEFIHDDIFEKYYATFLDNDGIFSNDKIKWKLKEIYTLINTYDITTDRPNNFKWPDEDKKYLFNKILYILNNSDEYESWWEFWDQINTELQWLNIDMIIEWNIEDYSSRNEQINKIKEGLVKYLDKLYSNCSYDISTEKAIEEMVEKIIKIINKK